MLGPEPGRVRAPGSGRAAPRPPRPSRASRASPPAPRSPLQQEAHSGNAWPKLFFFLPFPRPERAMLGDVVAPVGIWGNGVSALHVVAQPRVPLGDGDAASSLEFNPKTHPACVPISIYCPSLAQALASPVFMRPLLP